jgi:hypothetical protein
MSGLGSNKLHESVHSRVCARSRSQLDYLGTIEIFTSSNYSRSDRSFDGRSTSTRYYRRDLTQ